MVATTSLTCPENGSHFNCKFDSILLGSFALKFIFKSLGEPLLKSIVFVLLVLTACYRHLQPSSWFKELCNSKIASLKLAICILACF